MHFAMRAAALAAGRAGLRFDERRAAGALRGAVPPGRFQRLRIGGRRVIVDGAHNAEGIAALLMEFSGRRPAVCVAAFMSDKDSGALAAALAAETERLVLTRSFSYRSAPPEAVRKLLPAPFRRAAMVIENPLEAVRRAVGLAPEGGTVLVAGSLYLAGDVLAWLKGGRAFHPREMLTQS